MLANLRHNDSNSSLQQNHIHSDSSMFFICFKVFFPKILASQQCCVYDIQVRCKQDCTQIYGCTTFWTAAAANISEIGYLDGAFGQHVALHASLFPRNSSAVLGIRYCKMKPIFLSWSSLSSTSNCLRWFMSYQNSCRYNIMHQTYIQTREHGVVFEQEATCVRIALNKFFSEPNVMKLSYSLNGIVPNYSTLFAVC